MLAWVRGRYRPILRTVCRHIVQLPIFRQIVLPLSSVVQNGGIATDRHFNRPTLQRAAFQLADTSTGRSAHWHKLASSCRTDLFHLWCHSVHFCLSNIPSHQPKFILEFIILNSNFICCSTVLLFTCWNSFSGRIPDLEKGRISGWPDIRCNPSNQAY